MGWLRGITGVQAQIDATRKQAELDAANIDKTSKLQAEATNQATQAAADSLQQRAARDAAEAQVTDALSKSPQVADVRLSTPQEETVTASSRRRRASFGRNYSSGVNI